MKKIKSETRKLLNKTYFLDRNENMGIDKGDGENKNRRIHYEGTTQKKMDYLLPTECATKYVEIAGEMVNGTKRTPASQTKLKRCNKRTCSFCNKELVNRKTEVVTRALNGAISKKYSIHMITKTIPNLYISPSAGQQIMQVQRIFTKNLKRDKSTAAKIYGEKFSSEIIKKEYTVNYFQDDARAYNIHYQNIIITKKDITDFDIAIINKHWLRAMRLVFKKTKFAKTAKPVGINKDGILQKDYTNENKTGMIRKRNKMVKEIAKYVGKDDANLTITSIKQNLEKSKRRSAARGETDKVEHYTKQLAAIDKDHLKAFRRHLESIYAFKGKIMIQYTGELRKEKILEKPEAPNLGKFEAKGYKIVQDFGKVFRDIGTFYQGNLPEEKRNKELIQYSLEEIIELLSKYGKEIISEELDPQEILTPSILKSIYRIYHDGNEMPPEELLEAPEMNAYTLLALASAITDKVKENKEALREIFSKEHGPALYEIEETEDEKEKQTSTDGSNLVL